MENKPALKSFYIYANKWCPRRGIESSQLYQYFLANNLKPVDNQQEADLLVIYTCGLFSKNEESSINTIEKALENEKAKVIITGCLPKINPERLKDFSKTDMIFPENIAKLDQVIHAKTKYQDIPNASLIQGIHDLCPARGTEESALVALERRLENRLFKKSEEVLFSSKTYKLEIAKGCLGNCSYCAIKLAMDKFHSYPEEQILESFRKGLEGGYKDFALVAGDIGCYGVDINSTLPALLTKLLAVNGDYKILLWDLSASWFIKYYPELRSIFGKNANKISKVIVPIESGSNKILKLMNRPYRIEEVKDCFLDILKTIPSLKLETQIIVGFPTETDKDFEESLEIAKAVNFSKVTVFKYEERPNTEAATFTDKIPKNIIDERVKILEREVRTIVVN